MEYLAKLLMNWCIRKDKVFKITGTAGPDDVYLIRYYILRSKYMNIFLHQFLRSDRDDLHDHPWNFATYLIKGAYTENKFDEVTGVVTQTRRANYDRYSPNFLTPIDHVKQNTLVFRKATDQHQVVVDRDLKESEKDQAALTLFISGPTKRDWGFIVEEDSMFYNELKAGIKMRRWIDWRTYLGLPKDTPGRG